MAFAIFPLGRVYGIDSIIESLSALVAALVAYQSYKVYKFIKKRDFKYLSLAFILITISFLFKVISNFTIVHYVDISNSQTTFVIISHLQSMQWIYFISLICYRVFLILGLLIMFFITTKITEIKKIFLYVYLGLLAVLISFFFGFIFYLTLVFILVFLTTYFYQNYRENSNVHSLMVFLGFMFITFSKLLLIFYSNSVIYLIGEFFLLFGFITLLLNQIIIKNEQKTKQVRSDKRYPRLVAKK